MDKNILGMIFTFIGGSTFSAIIAGLFNLKKNKVDATDASVKTVLEIEKIAMERYTSTSEKLTVVEHLLGEVREELEDYKNYVEVLKNVLRQHNIDIPKMETEIKKDEVKKEK